MAITTVGRSGGSGWIVGNRCRDCKYWVTLNRKHFLEDPNVARSSGLRIGTPGDAVAWVRASLR